MKKHVPMIGVISKIVVPLLLVALCLLTVSTIQTINRSNLASSGEFDLDGLTNEAGRDVANAADYLLPEFIGVTVNGVRSGVSTSSNIVADLYDILAPTVNIALTSVIPLPDTAWEEYTSEKNSVYIKYHSELPDGIIALFSVTSEEDEKNVSFGGNVREIFYIPSASSESVLATRSDSGKVKKYVIPRSKSTVGTDELERFVRLYEGVMSPYIFNEDNISNLSWSEPVFTESIQTRQLIMTDGTCDLIQNSTVEKKAVLRLFGLNPDKLLSVHEGTNESTSYSDAHGILYLRDSSFVYVPSSADNARSVSEVLGASSVSDSAGEILWDYIQTALLLYEEVAEIDRNYAGGEAQLLLKSAESENGEVTLRFFYAVGNIPLSDERDAYRITFSGGKILRVELHTIAVRVLIERDESYTEWWFASKLQQYSTDVRLVYRSDYISEAVSAEWVAEELYFKNSDAYVSAEEDMEGENGE